MNEERFSISELAAAAATTPRTIRFYTAEGLLPSPLTEGRNAIYTETHRRRLRLIQRLKAAYLPLSAIKDQLAGLSDDQVNVLLERGGPHRVENTGVNTRGARQKAPASPPVVSSVDYVARILAMANQALAPSDEPQKSGQPKRVLIVSPRLRADNDSGTVDDVIAPSYSPVAERWQRITLRPGIELLVRDPIPAAYRAGLDRIVELAEALLPETLPSSPSNEFGKSSR